MMSFQRFTLNELVSGNTPFVGLDNYTRALPDPNFPASLVNSTRVHGRVGRPPVHDRLRSRDPLQPAVSP